LLVAIEKTTYLHKYINELFKRRDGLDRLFDRSHVSPISTISQVAIPDSLDDILPWLFAD